jgi:hypothetical protein
MNITYTSYDKVLAPEALKNKGLALRRAVHSIAIRQAKDLIIYVIKTSLIISSDLS